MKQPAKPLKKVIVLSNSWFNEFKPDIVGEFKSKETAEKWIREKLLEEPGDIYIIYTLGSCFHTQVNVRKT